MNRDGLMFHQVFYHLLAIRWCTEEDFNELFSIIDIFIENDRLHDACELYISLLDKFPHVSEGLLNDSHIDWIA